MAWTFPAPLQKHAAKHKTGGSDPLLASHLPAHTHASAAQGGTVAHSVTTGQGVNDHHNKSHAHTVADGSGAISSDQNITTSGQTFGTSTWGVVAHGTTGSNTFTFTVGNPTAWAVYYYEIITLHRKSSGEINMQRWGMFVHDDDGDGVDAISSTKLLSTNYGGSLDNSFSLSGTTVTCTLPSDPDGTAYYVVYGFSGQAQ